MYISNQNAESNITSKYNIVVRNNEGLNRVWYEVILVKFIRLIDIMFWKNHLAEYDFWPS